VTYFLTKILQKHKTYEQYSVYILSTNVCIYEEIRITEDSKLGQKNDVGSLKGRNMLAKICDNRTSV